MATITEQPAQATPNTPFHQIGGHAVMQAIVDRFYDLMDSDPAYAELRAMHAPDLAPMRKGLALFLAAWAGGPNDWFAANRGRCMMSIHRPYRIDGAVAGQWAEAMQRAVADVAPAEHELATAMGAKLAELAIGMANA